MRLTARLKRGGILSLVLLCCRNGCGAFATQFSVRESFQCTSCTAFVSTGLRRLASRADNSSFWLQSSKSFSTRANVKACKTRSLASLRQSGCLKKAQWKPKPSKRVSLAFWSAFLSACVPTRVSAARFACSILIAARGPAFEAPLRATSAPSTKTAVRRRPHAQHALRCSGARAARGERGDHRSVADPDRARARDGTK